MGQYGTDDIPFALKKLSFGRLDPRTYKPIAYGSSRMGSGDDTIECHLITFDLGGDETRENVFLQYPFPRGG